MASSRATAVAPIGPVAVGSMLWRDRGRMHLTAIVKARLAIVHGGPMRVIGPVPLVERDVHEDHDPTHSLREASDFVPFRAHADVWLRGHAASPGPPASVSVVRLALYRGREALLDKTIHVVGERVREGAPPRPFRRMPLVYERARGGIGHDDNPVGVGARDSGRLPNLLHPDDPQGSIGFGPISRYWKLRRDCLGGTDRRELERGLIDVPEGFDGGYFQAAPLDQRIDFLEGDEWLVLDGMHPEQLRLQSRLPRLDAAARLFTEGAVDRAGIPIPLLADTLAIDADAKICTLVWRGAIALEGSLDRLLVAGALLGDGRRDADVDWAQAAETATKAPEPGVSSPVLDQSTVTTVTDPGDPDFGQTIVDKSDRSFRGESDLGDEPQDGADATAPMRMPLAIDTEPGGPPMGDDDLPWIREAALEPEPDTQRRPGSARAVEAPASQQRLSSLPPAPLDRQAYARALRQAGASEADIEALLRFLSDA